MTAPDTASIRATIAARDADGTGVVCLTTDEALALCDVYDRHGEGAVRLGEPSSIWRDSFTNGLVMRWWRRGREGETSTVDVAEVRIEPEHLVEFAMRISQDAWTAVEDIAFDYGYGDCDTCGNRRVVDVMRNERSMTIYCPECHHGKPSPVPFGNRPKHRPGTWDPTTPYDPKVHG